MRYNAYEHALDCLQVTGGPTSSCVKDVNSLLPKIQQISLPADHAKIDDAVDDLKTAQSWQTPGLKRNYEISAPVLGISFDRNDLGMIAGVSFCIFLCALLGGLKRLHWSIQAAKTVIEDEANGRVLALATELFVPADNLILRGLPLLGVIAMIVSLFGCIMYNDFGTVNVSSTSDWRYAVAMVTRCETGCAVLIVILSTLCVSAWLRVARATDIGSVTHPLPPNRRRDMLPHGGSESSTERLHLAHPTSHDVLTQSTKAQKELPSGTEPSKSSAARTRK